MANWEDALKLENQLCFPLYACSRKIINLYTPLLKPLNLTYTQYLVMLALWENDNVPVKHLCDRLFLDTGTVTPLLKKLETAGYLSRTRCTEDERVVYISLTEKGKALKNQCKDIPIQIGTCLSLSEEEAITLHNVLHQILN